MVALALLERPEVPPLLLLDKREGVVVIVADPVVLRMVEAEVEVRDETMPSEVVTMTVTICCVDVATRAEVIVVFDVLLLVEDVLLVTDVFEDVSGLEVSLVGATTDVVSLVEVDLVVTVVGVLLDTVVDVTVTTEEEMMVVLDGAAAVDGVEVAAAAVDEPVPAACRL
jgi:hypothetical protein